MRSNTRFAPSACNQGRVGKSALAGKKRLELFKKLLVPSSEVIEPAPRILRGNFDLFRPIKSLIFPQITEYEIVRGNADVDFLIIQIEKE